jgi:hypothetical protein
MKLSPSNFFNWAVYLNSGDSNSIAAILQDLTVNGKISQSFTFKQPVMRKLFLLSLFFIVASTCLTAQIQKSQEQAKVNQAVTGFFAGLAALDTRIMKQHTTKDFLLLEDGAVWNMDTLTSKLNPLKSGSFSRTNHLNFIHTEVKGNTAWVAYNNSAEMSVNGQKKNVQWLESAVLVKESKDWKVQLLHSTPLKPKNN